MKAVAPFAAFALLAGCSAERATEPDPVPTATVAVPRTLVAADLDPATLGARIVGPQGSDPSFAVMADGKQVARVVSYVACPRRMTACVPDELPQGTMFTYVHTITPTLADDARPAPAADIPAAPAELPPALFRMTRPAPGFAGAVGYSRAEAEAALGDAAAIDVTLDEGQLIWRVTGVSRWKPGASVSVWWRTSAPPAGPQDAFRIELMDQTATVRAPFPAVEKAVERNP